MLKVTGNLLYLLKKYFLDYLGKEKFEELIKDFDPETKEILQNPVLSGEWYEIRHYEALLNKVDTDIGRKAIDEYSVYIAKKQLSGIYGFVTKFVSLERLIKNSKTLWSKLYTEGEVEILENSNESIKLLVTQMELSKVYKYSLTLYLKTWLELIKKKEVKMLIKELSKNSFEMHFNF